MPRARDPMISLHKCVSHRKNISTGRGELLWRSPPAPHVNAGSWIEVNDILVHPAFARPARTL